MSCMYHDNSVISCRECTVADLRASLAAVTAEAQKADERETKVRNALTAAGIPDWEPYPPEDVDAWEASLRTGGRMIQGDERVRRLAAERDALADKLMIAEIAFNNIHDAYRDTGLACDDIAFNALAAIAAVKPT